MKAEYSNGCIIAPAQASATMAEIMMEEQLKHKSGGATGKGSDDLTLVKREAELTTTYHKNLGRRLYHQRVVKPRGISPINRKQVDATSK